VFSESEFGCLSPDGGERKKFKERETLVSSPQGGFPGIGVQSSQRKKRSRGVAAGVVKKPLDPSGCEVRREGTRTVLRLSSEGKRKPSKLVHNQRPCARGDKVSVPDQKKVKK